MQKRDEFDSAGEDLGYVSLDQAVLEARRLARQDQHLYLDRLRWDEIVWSESGSERREDSYRVVLRFRRPARGVREEQTGEEEFIFDLTGQLEDRQVLLWPKPRLRFLALRTAASRIDTHAITRAIAGVGLVVWSALLTAGGVSSVSEERVSAKIVLFVAAVVTAVAGGLLLGWNWRQLNRFRKPKLVLWLSIVGIVVSAVGIGLTGPRSG